MPEAITSSTVIRKHSVKKYLNALTKGQALDARVELAEKLQLTYHHFVRLSNIALDDDRYQLSEEQATLLAQYFGVSVDDILSPYEETKL